MEFQPDVQHRKGQGSRHHPMGHHWEHIFEVHGHLKLTIMMYVDDLIVFIEGKADPG